MALTWIRTHDWDVDAWRMRSACLDSDPDVFFPIGTTGGALEQIETAKRICTACLVTDECLDEGDERTKALAGLDRSIRTLQTQVDKNCD